MVHNMKLQAKPFRKIKDGSKTIELRLLDEKRKLLKIGDIIEFLNLENKTEKIRVEILALHKFESFKHLYNVLPLEKCGYDSEELCSADSKDMELYYSVEEQQKHGVLGIEIKLLPWKSSDLIRTSRYISMLLRHKPEAAGISLDKNGWAKVDELIIGVNKTHQLNMEILEEIVSTDDKQRYSFNEDKTLIRANQGHSIDVDVELEECVPPDILWHGTGTKYVEEIKKEGLKPRTRLYVHLSSDYETAHSVGSRHGQPYVFKINTKKMKKAALELSKPFPHVRVDFCVENKKPWFGEFTFFPGAGYDEFNPEEFSLKMGKWLDLSAITKGVYNYGKTKTE